MSSEPTPTRRPIAALRVSTVALIGVVAAVAVPAGAAGIVMSGSFDGHQQEQKLNAAGPITRVVVVDNDSSVRVTGNPAVIGMTGKTDLSWHGSAAPQVTQQYANGVLTLTKDCGGGDCGADIDIQVPPTVSVQVTTTNAGIFVSDISGGVDLHDSNAEISADRLGAGDATMTTSNARIVAAFAGGPKNIWARTSNAKVTITTDGRTPYFDQVTTSNGNTRLLNDQNRYTDNTIDVLTSNADVTIR
jgi:hypothetical protein